MKAVESRTLRMLVATFLASLLALVLAHTAPVAAQEVSTQTGNEAQTLTKNQYASSEEPKQSVLQSGQQAQVAEGENSQTAARAADPLSGETAELINIGGRGEDVDRITVQVADCTEPDAGATLTVEGDDEDAAVTISNSGDNTFEANDDQIIVTRVNGGDIEASNIRNLEVGRGSVVSSTGITCGRDSEDAAAGDGATAGDDARTADELRELSCEELLVLFRAGGSSGQGQYGDAAALADADVQSRIEVCLEQEVVQGTAAGEDLPDTGGVSLLGLAVLGVVSAAAGLSVIRAGRREG